MNRKVTVVGGAGNVGATVARAIALDPQGISRLSMATAAELCDWVGELRHA